MRIERGEIITLIIDGHNVAGYLEIFELLKEQQAELRGRVISSIVAKEFLRPHEIIIVFDGSDSVSVSQNYSVQNREVEGKNIQVRFAESADDHIVFLVCKMYKGSTLRVVTRDRLLRSRINRVARGLVEHPDQVYLHGLIELKKEQKRQLSHGKGKRGKRASSRH